MKAQHFTTLEAWSPEIMLKQGKDDLCHHAGKVIPEKRKQDSPLTVSSQGFSKGATWVDGLTSPTGEGGRADTVVF